MMAAQVGIALALGTAVMLAIWGGRAWLLDRFNRHVKWVNDTWLRFNPTPPDAFTLTIMIYIGAVLMLLIMFWLIPAWYIALPVWLFLLFVPRIFIEAAWNKRKQKIDRQLAATIATMCNSMRAGLTLVQALERLANTAPEPIRTEFMIMKNTYALGAGLEATVRQAKERLKLNNFNLFASALLLNREMGGDIGETLWRISQSLDKLRQMRQTIEAHTSEGRTNIRVLLVAPVFMLLLVATVDSEGVSLLFSTPQGYAILLIAGGLIGLGVWMASAITRQQI